MNKSINTGKELNKIRHACFQNAETFINAAKELTDKNFEHIRYHLGALALEEIGKASLLTMQFIVQRRKQSDSEFNPTLEDHVKKLFCI
jgi:AbiV family abortive infection protein